MVVAWGIFGTPSLPRYPVSTPTNIQYNAEARMFNLEVFKSWRRWGGIVSPASQYAPFPSLKSRKGMVGKERQMMRNEGSAVAASVELGVGAPRRDDIPHRPTPIRRTSCFPFFREAKNTSL
jgi:hypothetical protein